MIFQAYLGWLVEMTNIFGIVFRITYQCLAILGIYGLSSQRFSQLFDGNPKEWGMEIPRNWRREFCWEKHSCCPCGLGFNSGTPKNLMIDLAREKTWIFYWRGRSQDMCCKNKKNKHLPWIWFASPVCHKKFWLPTTASRTLGHCVLRWCMTPRSRRWSIHTLKGEKASCESASRRGCGND